MFSKTTIIKQSEYFFVIQLVLILTLKFRGVRAQVVKYLRSSSLEEIPTD